MSSESEKERALPSAEGMAPDPDEDDLDDLDEMLDEFSTIKLVDNEGQLPHTAPPGPSGPGRPGPPAIGVDLGEEDFAKQLQDGMASLLGEMDKDPGMKKELEDLMKGLGSAGEPTAASGTLPGTTLSSSKPEEQSFQDTIQRTMERMSSSSEQASAAASSGGSDDILAQMLKEMQSGGFDGANEEDFNKMLFGMMQQLTNKEILYEPMKEFDQKFPGFLEKYRNNLSSDDLSRYLEQQRLVGEVVAWFERKEYSDDSAADRQFVVERMQKMQDAGAPPPEIVGEMEGSDEALGALDAGCPQQ